MTGPSKSIHDSVEKTLTRLKSWSAFDETITPEELQTPEPERVRPGGAKLDLRQAGLEVLEVIAEGGMGRVLRAKQRSLQRDVAVKTVRPEITSDAMSSALHEESVITGSLEHPNIIPVHSLGTDGDGQPFLVMKRIDGVPWSELIRDRVHAAWARVGVVDDDLLAAQLGILVAVCSAVHYSHRHGVIHRDIKPSNVMVGELGEVYLVDWGIATAIDPDDPRFRKTRLGLVGTPSFIAPEMVAEDGGRVDERTDVYLLGATLHYLLTGTPRHRGGELEMMFEIASRSEPATYDDAVPEEIAAIANQACHRDPEQRFATAAAFRNAIIQFLGHRASIALSDKARARLETVHELWLESTRPGAPSDRPHLRRLLTECRYGFANALDAWSGNQRAREGLQACALLTLRDELAQGNLLGAEAAVLEVDAPPPELLAVLARLRAETQQRADRDARYRELDRQHDWRRAAGTRVAFFLGMAVLSIGLWLWENDGLRYERTYAPERLAALVGVGLAVFSAMVFAARKQLMTSLVNARLVYGVLLAIAAMFVNRVANIITVPYSAMLVSTELVFCALAAALGGLLLARWLWLQVPIWIAGAFLVRALPTYGGLVFMITAVVALALGIWRLRRVTAPGKPD